MNLVLVGMQAFKITPFTNPSGKKVFRIYGRMPSGKVVRENVKTYIDAVARRQELEIEALNQPVTLMLRKTRLSDSQLADAEAAFQRLKDSGHTLVDCVEHFFKTWCPGTVERHLDQAYREFLADKKAANLREDSLNNLRVRIGRLVKSHPGKLVCEVQVLDIKASIHRAGWSPVMRVNERRALHNFFGWAVKSGYCRTNPVAEIDAPKIERAEPQILTLGEVKELLRAARDYEGGFLLPYVVVSLFAGLRPAEARRIAWTAIDLKGQLLTVRGAVAKLRQRRLVKLDDNAIDWLMLCQGRPVYPPTNFQKNFAEVRRLSGFAGGLGTEKDKELKAWTPDVLRHTALSYHLAQWENEGKTARWAGNSPDVLHRHYKGLVRPDDAEVYWSITPQNVDTSDIVAMPGVAA